MFASSKRIYRQSSMSHTEFRDSIDYFRPYLADVLFL